MRRAPRAYITWLYGSVIVVLLVSLATNLRVNPWRVIPSALSDPALEPYRDYSAQLRTGKSGYVRSHPQIGVAMVGSSRVASALSPENPAWGREDVINFGFGAGYLYESEALIRYLISRHQPELVIMGIDPGDLGSEVDTRGIGDFHSSPLGPPKDAINREIRYRIGISTFESSIETLRRKWTNGQPQYTPRGQRYHPPQRAVFAQREFLKQTFAGEARLGLPPLGTGIENREMNLEKTALLGRLMKDLRARGIRFVCLLHPQHALLHARAGFIDRPVVPFEHERRAVLRLAEEANALELPGPPVEVWDFGGFQPINCEPIPADNQSLMQYWGDLNHYSTAVGNLILARIMGWPSPIEGGDDYGIRLTPENIDGWFDRARRDFSAYLAGDGAADLEWKQGLMNPAAAR